MGARTLLLWLEAILLNILFAIAALAALAACTVLVGMGFGVIVWLLTGEYPFTHPWMEG